MKQFMSAKRNKAPLQLKKLTKNIYLDDKKDKM